MSPSRRRRGWDSDTRRIETAYELPADVRHTAALIVCGNARDVDDARQIMQALGLSDYDEGPHE